VSKGVDESRIRAEGMGEKEPVADNKSPEGRANNRRVEMLLEESSKAKQAPQEQKQQGQPMQP
jgi:OOP family OmpA-OmpF porin